MKTLEQKMQESGYRMRTVKISHLEDLQKDAEENFNRGNVDENLEKWLREFYRFDPASVDPAFSSILVIASKSPLVRTVFQWKGRSRTFIMPPTYFDFISEPERIAEHLKNAAGGDKYRFEPANRLPNKLLAARSGLGGYGRNNLCFVPGMGSYVLLTAIFTDMPVKEDHWGPVQQIPACGACGRCIKKCPCGALPEDRFAVHAESCVTYHNEFWGKPEFPEWLPPGVHNSLVGCMTCQAVCPENKNLLEVYKNVEVFSEEETEAILDKRAFEELPEALSGKLEKVTLHVHYSYLSRNLKALLERPVRSPAGPDPSVRGQ